MYQILFLKAFHVHFLSATFVHFITATDSVLDVGKYKALPFQYKLARFSLLLLKAYPFLGEVCMRVEKYFNDTQGFAATDGYRLYLNEEKMNELPEETLNFILLHGKRQIRRRT